MRNTKVGMTWLRRWRRDIALAICISAAVGILLASELGHRELARGYERGMQALWLGARLNELAAKLADAETGQRSFLLTWNKEYLDPYRRAVPAIRRLLDELRSYYAARPDREADKVFEALVTAVGARLSEIELTLQLTEQWRGDRALAVIDSGVGQRTMNEIRLLLGDLAEREDGLVAEASRDWRRSLDLSRLSIAGATALNVLLLALLFCAIRRDSRRAQERQAVLDRKVRERTRQLDSLASRLQEANEAEKAAMARELHDELGALLTASKMDVAWVAKQLGSEYPRLKAKLAAVTALLDHGLLAKRRIVEGLRPSALCYFGICTAARELAEQAAERAGWSLVLDMPDKDPELSADLEITLYRVLQESLTNAAKYAQAGSVRVSLQCDPSRCSLDVVDDGTGFRIDQIRADAQGLFGMRHRVEARSGHFTVVSAPGAGTRISVIIPRRVPSIPVPAAPHEPQRVEWETVQA